MQIRKDGAPREPDGAGAAEMRALLDDYRQLGGTERKALRHLARSFVDLPCPAPIVAAETAAVVCKVSRRHADRRYSRFRAALLAPVSDDHRGRRGPPFEHEKRRLASEGWRQSMQHVYQADHFRSYEAARCSIAYDTADISGPIVRAAEERKDAAQRAFVAAVDRQMRVPAPTAGALKWKRQHRRLDGGRAWWEVLIAADETRLAVAP